MTKTLYVGRPNVGDVDRILDKTRLILDSLWLTNIGPAVKKFESRVAEYLGVRHFVATCNATVALEIAARALDLTGEVIVPAWTFVATAHAMKWVGLEPVLCDVGEDHNIDPREAAMLAGPRTSAILAVHLWGKPADTQALWRFARERGIKLIYDAAHAFGVPDLAGCGDCSVYSFHATKVFNTLEGGGIATNNGSLAQRCRRMRNFGFESEDNVVDLGINGKMNEVCAAVGLVNLGSVSDFIEHNQTIWATYSEHLPKECSLLNTGFRSNYHYVVVTLEERDKVYDYLKQVGVMARRYFSPGIHRMLPYSYDRELPVTDRLARTTLVLPTGMQMTQADAVRVCCFIKEAL